MMGDEKWSVGKLMLVALIALVSFSIIVYVLRFFAYQTTYAMNEIDRHTQGRMIFNSFLSILNAIIFWIANILSCPYSIALLIALSIIVIALEMRW